MNFVYDLLCKMYLPDVWQLEIVSYFIRSWIYNHYWR